MGKIGRYLLIGALGFLLSGVGVYIVLGYVDIGSEGDETEVVETKERDACSITSNEPKVKIEDVVDRDEEPWSDGYVPDDSHLNFLTIDEFSEKVDSGERFVIYIGRVTCPFSYRYRQTQDPALEQLDAEIYTIDTEFYRDNEQLAELRESLHNEYVPDVLLIDNGETLDALQNYEDYADWSVDELAEWIDSLLQ